jgi:Rad3-related DNA helicase
MVGNHTTEPFDVNNAVDKLNNNDTADDNSEDGPTPVSFDNRDTIKSIVEQVWPAPEFRQHQKKTVVDILEELYIQDNDVVTLSAPTGAGKSLIIYAVGRVLSVMQDAQSFVTTPLNSLIDQINDDDFIQNVTTIKGKNNYHCVHPRDKGTAVSDAICQRQDDFSCRFKDQFDTNDGCPYYGRKIRAMNTDITVTNLSYLMANSMIPETEDARFQPRNFLALDECQNIENFALNFIGFSIDRREIPVNFKLIDDMPEKGCDMKVMVSWLKQVLTAIINRLMELNQKPRLTATENSDEDDLEQLKHRISNFVEDFDKGRHWTKTRDGSTIKFEPVFIDRFIDKFLWSQSEKVLLSSATIPKGDFLDTIGLQDKSVKHVTVPSTFPKKRRPVITRETVGKMTKSERDQTIPKLADKLAEIANYHDGEQGFVHCNSYDIMQRIYDNLPKHVQRRTMMQDANARTESLEEWFDSPHQIFLSVAQDEGISLDDDKARWQVIAKASYPFMGDERVNYRVNEMNDWQWYAGQAVIDLQQAVGRGMRSKEDYCVNYLLDSSFKNLLNKNQELFEPWFLDSIDCYTDRNTYSSTDTNFSFSS